YYNEKMMEREVLMQESIIESPNPFRTAVKHAITGNIIDFGGRHDIDENMIMREIDRKRSRALYIDHSKILRGKILNAEKLMYLGDNCGEIIFDKLLIEEIVKLNPEIEVTYVVRGAPVINDIIMEDALQVGMNKLARVIDNGYEGPGTELENCTPEFTKEFMDADVIISKGQGNLESLFDSDHKGLFFLLMVKCEAVARRVNAKMGSQVCLYKNA
ncbi:MAG: damage-control phosphatase ARMT1 family protein, partial [Bacteroidota bacterium]